MSARFPLISLMCMGDVLLIIEVISLFFCAKIILFYISVSFCKKNTALALSVGVVEGVLSLFYLVY